MSEGTEQPTPQRLRRAREQGQVPRSRVLPGALAVLGALTALRMGAPAGMAHLEAWTARLCLAPKGEPRAALAEAGGLLFALAGPPVLGAGLGVLVGLVAGTGLTLRPGHVAPKLERLSPGPALKRLFGLEPWAEAGRALVVAGVLAVLLGGAAVEAAGDVVRAVGLPGAAALRVLALRLVEALVPAAWVLGGLGLVDLALARRRHLRQLRMTREEVRREHKDSEGDPHHKARRRAAHHELARGGPARGVAQATAVVVNPTHVAVALRWAPAECDAPYLVARGREGDALALRRQAERRGIPVVRDVALARSLVHYDVGEAIPEELYEAAAAVLRVALGPAQGAGGGGRT